MFAAETVDAISTGVPAVVTALLARMDGELVVGALTSLAARGMPAKNSRGPHRQRGYIRCGSPVNGSTSQPRAGTQTFRPVRSVC